MQGQVLFDRVCWGFSLWLAWAMRSLTLAHLWFFLRHFPDFLCSMEGAVECLPVWFHASISVFISRMGVGESMDSPYFLTVLRVLLILGGSHLPI